MVNGTTRRYTCTQNNKGNEAHTGVRRADQS